MQTQVYVDETSTLVSERVRVDLYAADVGYRTNIERRRACLDRLVQDVAATCVGLTLESDVTQNSRDRQDLIEITRRVGCRDLRYAHRAPYEEPLLWIPDAIGWAHARGGVWRERASPVIHRAISI